MVHVEDVFALAGEDGTVVARDMAVGTAAVKGHAADPADVVVGHIPLPHRNRVHPLHRHLHRLQQQASAVEWLSWRLTRLVRVARRRSRSTTLTQLGRDCNFSLWFYSVWAFFYFFNCPGDRPRGVHQIHPPPGTRHVVACYRPPRLTSAPANRKTSKRRK